MRLKRIIIPVLCTVLSVSAQAGNANQQSDSGCGLQYPPGLFVQHSLSFSASSASGSGTQSEGMYSTMLTYQFKKPLTINLDFSLPLYSTFSHEQNLTAGNLFSEEYFNTIPIDISVDWHPSDQLFFQLNVVRNPPCDRFYGFPYP